MLFKCVTYSLGNQSFVGGCVRSGQSAYTILIERPLPDPTVLCHLYTALATPSTEGANDHARMLALLVAASSDGLVGRNNHQNALQEYR